MSKWRRTLTTAIPLAALAMLVLGVQNPSWAAPPGFGSEQDTVETQGNSGKPAKNNDNEGIQTTTTTTTGPKGALKNDKEHAQPRDHHDFEWPRQQSALVDLVGSAGSFSSQADVDHR